MNVFWQKKYGQKEKHATFHYTYYLTHKGLDKNIIGTVYNKKISTKNGFLTNYWTTIKTETLKRMALKNVIKQQEKFQK